MFGAQRSTQPSVSTLPRKDPLVAKFWSATAAAAAAAANASPPPPPTDEEIVTEVRHILNGMVQLVATRHFVENNQAMLDDLEAYQRACWARAEDRYQQQRAKTLPTPTVRPRPKTSTSSADCDGSVADHRAGNKDHTDDKHDDANNNQ